MVTIESDRGQSGLTTKSDRMSDQHDAPERLKKWQKTWDENNITFHKGEANPTLLARYNQITRGQKELTFLIPLCGKSLDLLWLYELGHTVIGVEGVEKAILEFFSEHKIDYEIKTTGPGLVYVSADGRLRIHRGDFFEYSRDLIGEVDCVWDRCALVALYVQDRSKYAQLMKSFLSPTFHYLLQTIEYKSTDTRDVTPRSISFDEVVQLFGDVCSVEILNTKELNREEERQIDAPVVYQHDLLLTRKGSCLRHNCWGNHCKH